jgi:hypothetical protein
LRTSSESNRFEILDVALEPPPRYHKTPAGDALGRWTAVSRIHYQLIISALVVAVGSREAHGLYAAGLDDYIASDPAHYVGSPSPRRVTFPRWQTFGGHCGSALPAPPSATP